MMESAKNVSWRRAPPGWSTECTCGVSPKRVAMMTSRRSGCQSKNRADRAPGHRARFLRAWEGVGGDGLAAFRMPVQDPGGSRLCVSRQFLAYLGWDWRYTFGSDRRR